MKYLILVGNLLSFFSVFGQSETKVVKIEPHKSVENYEHFRRLVLSSPDSNLEFLKGFDFQWGIEYEVKVKETRLKEVWSDGTKFEYEFIKVANSQPTKDSTFLMMLNNEIYYYNLPEDERDMGIALKQVNDSVYRYMDQVNIIVPEELKIKFDKVIEGTPKRGQFTYDFKGNIILLSFK